MIGSPMRIAQNMNKHLENSAKFINVAASGTGGYRGALNC